MANDNIIPVFNVQNKATPFEAKNKENPISPMITTLQMTIPSMAPSDNLPDVDEDDEGILKMRVKKKKLRKKKKKKETKQKRKKKKKVKKEKKKVKKEMNMNMKKKMLTLFALMIVLIAFCWMHVKKANV